MSVAVNLQFGLLAALCTHKCLALASQTPHVDFAQVRRHFHTPAPGIHEIQFVGRSKVHPHPGIHSPNASEPVRDEGERGHEEDEDGRAVLRVAVDLARHAHQPQQPRSLQQPDQGRRLKQG